MKKIRNFLILSIAILSVSLTTINAQSFSDNKSARTIEQKVFKEILKLPYYGVFDHIAYKVEGSTVTLYGKVNNGSNKSSAKRVVEDIPGVERVINNIEILPPSPFDDSIRRQLIRTLAGTGSVYRYLREPNPSVRLIVDRGNITLEGFVANRSDADLMNILASGVPGAFNVRNNLVVDRDRLR